jgi:hypothetical protein
MMRTKYLFTDHQRLLVERACLFVLLLLLMKTSQIMQGFCRVRVIGW